MKIFVCVKSVPDTAATIKVVGDTGFDGTIKFLVNPYDEYAIEEAVRLSEKESGEVVVVLVGEHNAVFFAEVCTFFHVVDDPGSDLFACEFSGFGFAVEDADVGCSDF